MVKYHCWDALRLLDSTITVSVSSVEARLLEGPRRGEVMVYFLFVEICGMVNLMGSQMYRVPKGDSSSCRRIPSRLLEGRRTGEQIQG